MLPWEPFNVIRCIFCIYTSSKIQLLNHRNYIDHGYMPDIPPTGVQWYISYNILYNVTKGRKH